MLAVSDAHITHKYLFYLFSNPRFCLLRQTHYNCKGLEILAFPCNQFGCQEPGSNKKIQQLACTRFKAESSIFRKVRDFI
jgi:Glutathione peroxidase